MAEIRTTSSTGGMKGVKPERFSMIPPHALNVLAAMYGRGAEKYNETPDKPNWRKGYEWSKSYDSLMRHATAFWGGEDIDEETGYPHMAAVAFHALALITFMEEHPEFDDRYKSKSVSSDRSGLLDMLKPEATSEELCKEAKEAFLNAPQDHQVVSSEGHTVERSTSLKASNQPINVIRNLLGIQSPSAEAIAGFDAEVVERNMKAFKEEQERAVRDIAMRAHPAGSGLKKDDKSAPICAKCKYPIGCIEHAMWCRPSVNEK